MSETITKESCSIVENPRSRYEFDGVINGEHIKFEELEQYDMMEGHFKHVNKLTVISPDGKIREYIDFENDDLIVDGFFILRGGEITYGCNYESYYWFINGRIFQDDFDRYLNKITMEKLW